MKKLIGHCGVDSGQLLIVDPCYLNQWKDGEFHPKTKKIKNSYDEACKITCNTKESAGEMIISGAFGTGIVFASGYGDGEYPVYATYNKDKRIIKIEINME